MKYLHWLAVGFLMIYATVQAILSWTPSPGIGDFGAFLGVGQAIRTGVDPYSVLPTTPTLVVNGHASPWPNMNPPTLLPIWSLLVSLDPMFSFHVWFVVCLVLYIGIIALLLRAYPARRTPLFVSWLLALVPFWYSQWLGNIYVPLALFVVLAWLALHHGQRWQAAVLIGIVVAVKPNLFVWSLLILVSGDIAVALGSALITLLVGAIPLVLYGPVVYLQWLHAVLTYHDVDQRILGSVFSVGALVGLPEASTALGFVLATALVGFALVRARSLGKVLDVSALALVVSLLASPIAWNNYALLLLPIYAAHRWTPLLLASAALLLTPFGVLFPLLALALALIWPDRDRSVALDLTPRSLQNYAASLLVQRIPR